jgi:hypothetical protein
MNPWVTSQSAKVSIVVADHADDVRDVLLRSLTSLVSSSAQSAMTSGANRQIRHSGVFAVNHNQTGARARQKSALQSAAASVRFHHLQPLWTRVLLIYVTGFLDAPCEGFHTSAGLT